MENNLQDSFEAISDYNLEEDKVQILGWKHQNQPCYSVHDRSTGECLHSTEIPVNKINEDLGINPVQDLQERLGEVQDCKIEENKIHLLGKNKRGQYSMVHDLETGDCLSSYEVPFTQIPESVYLDQIDSKIEGNNHHFK